MKSIVLATVLSLGFGLANFATAAQTTSNAAAPQCDRACLIGFIDSYLDGLIRHDASRLALAPSYKATQNGHPMKLGEDFWKTAGEIKLRNYFADPQTGQAAFFGLITENDISLPFGLRLKIVKGKISEIETILTRPGPRQRLPVGVIRKNTIFEEILPERERTKHGMLLQTAHSYFDALEAHNGEVARWDTTCNRRENYVQLTNNIDIGSPLGCSDGIDHYTYHIYEVRKRRIPIVDEERGVVFTIVQFDRRQPHTDDPIYLARSRAVSTAQGQVANQPYQPSYLLLFEAFKIRNGKIRDVEAVMLTTPPGSPNGWDD